LSVIEKAVKAGEPAAQTLGRAGRDGGGIGVDAAFDRIDHEIAVTKSNQSVPNVRAARMSSSRLAGQGLPDP